MGGIERIDDFENLGLSEAIESDDPDALCARLSRLDFFVVDGGGNSLAHWASERRAPACLKRILEAGVPAAARNGSDQTPPFALVDEFSFHSRTRLGLGVAGIECLRLFLDFGADPNEIDGRGRSLLEALAFDPDACRLLLAAGAAADGPAAGLLRRGSPLHEAVAAAAPESVSLLLAAGAAMRTCPSDGTPFWAACGNTRRGAGECVRLLLEAGADPGESRSGMGALRRCEKNSPYPEELAAKILALAQSWARRGQDAFVAKAAKRHPILSSMASAFKEQKALLGVSASVSTKKRPSSL